MAVSLTYEQAAEELACATSTVKKLVVTGELEGVLLPVDGGERNEPRVLAYSLEDYLQRGCPGLAFEQHVRRATRELVVEEHADAVLAEVAAEQGADATAEAATA